MQVPWHRRRTRSVQRPSKRQFALEPLEERRLLFGADFSPEGVLTIATEAESDFRLKTSTAGKIQYGLGTSFQDLVVNSQTITAGSVTSIVFAANQVTTKIDLSGLKNLASGAETHISFPVDAATVPSLNPPVEEPPISDPPTDDAPSPDPWPSGLEYLPLGYQSPLARGVARAEFYGTQLIGADWKQQLGVTDIIKFVQTDQWRNALANESILSKIDPIRFGNLAKDLLGENWSQKLGAASASAYLQSGEWRDLFDPSELVTRLSATELIEAGTKLQEAINASRIASLTKAQTEESGDSGMVQAAATPTHFIIGSNYRDEIYTSGGDDAILGGEGDDLVDLRGFSGESYVDGGEGNDTIYGGGGNSTLFGAEGSDAIYGGSGSEVIDGGEGASEYIYGGGGTNTVRYLELGGQPATTITATTIQNNNNHNITYDDDFQVLQILTGVADDNITLQLSSAMPDTIRVDLGTGSDVLTIEGPSSATAFQVNTELAKITVPLSPNKEIFLQNGTVERVHVVGQNLTDSLSVTTGTRDQFISLGKYNGVTPAVDSIDVHGFSLISYSNVESATITSGSGDDTFKLGTLPSSVTLNLVAGAGRNTLDLSHNEITAFGTGSLQYKLPEAMSGFQVLDLRYNKLPLGTGTTLNPIVTLITGGSALPIDTLLLHGNLTNADGTTNLSALKGFPINYDLAAVGLAEAEQIEPYDINPTALATRIDAAITRVVQALHFNPLEIYEYLLNKFDYQPYAGVMKGPLATFLTKAGNDYDLGLLLQLMLSKLYTNNANFSSGATSLVSKRVGATDYTALANWLGVRDPIAVHTLLNDNALHSVRYNDSQTNTETIVFDHTVVTLQLATGGPTYILDPSWKLRDYHSPGRDALDAISTTTKQTLLDIIPFEEHNAGRTGYLDQARESSLAEWYAERVAASLPFETAFDTPLTTADFAYRGPIIGRTITSLPTGMPQVFGQSQDQLTLTRNSGEATSLGNIKDNWAALTHYVVVSIAQAGLSLSQGVFLADTALDPLYISYVPDVPGKVRPQFYHGDTQIGGDGVAMTSGAAASIQVGHYAVKTELTAAQDPDSLGGFFPYSASYLAFGDARSTVYNEAANTVIGIGIDAQQHVPALLFDLRAQLNSKLLAGLKDPTSVDQKTLGKLASLAMTTYFVSANQDRDVINGLLNTVTVPQFISSGIVRSSGSVSANNLFSTNLLLPIIPENLFINIGNLYRHNIGIDFDGSTHSVDLSNQRFSIEAELLSAREHLVWEQFTNLQGMSTVKSLQLAYSSSDTNQGVRVLTHDDWTTGGLRNTYYDNAATRFVVATIDQHLLNPPPSGTRKTVTVPKLPTQLNNWNGMGLIVLDESQHEGLWYSSGAAYLIVGANGSQGNGGAPTGRAVVQQRVNYVPSPGSQFRAGDPVNTANGAVVDDMVDVSLPNVGLPLSFARHYDALADAPVPSISAAPAGWGSSWATANYDFLLVGDFNGDGRDDVTMRQRGGTNNGYFITKLSTGSDFSSDVVSSANFAETNPFPPFSGQHWETARVGDFNGDGFDDIFIVKYEVGGGNEVKGYVSYSNGAGSFGSLHLWHTFSGTVLACDIGDFSGDGIDDVMINDGGNWHLRYMPAGTGEPFDASIGGSVAPYWETTRPRVLYGDFNGDTIDDAISLDLSGNFYLTSNSATGFSRVGWGQLPSVSTWTWDYDRIKVGDFNGDGKDDIAMWRTTASGVGRWYIGTSSSTGFQFAPWSSVDTGDLSNIIVGDFDGDRRSDIAVQETSSGTWYVNRSISVGEGFAFRKELLGSHSTWPASGLDYRPADFNGDGRSDLFSVQANMSGSGTHPTLVGLTQLVQASVAPRAMGTGWFYTYGDYLTIEGNDSVTWTNDQGARVNFVKDSGGTWIVPNSVRGEFRQDVANNFYEFRDKSGVAHRFLADSGRLDRISDANGNVVSVHYDGSGRMDWVSGSVNRIYFYYDSNNLIQYVKDGTESSARVWTYSYTTPSSSALRPQLNQVLSPSDSQTEQARTDYSYYGALGNSTDATYLGTPVAGLLKGHSTRVDGSEFATTIHTYYPNGRAFQTIDPLKHTQSYDYDLYRRRTSFYDELDNRNDYAYDKQGYLVTTTRPDGVVSTSTWENGLVTKSTDPYGVSTINVYGTAGSDDAKFGNVTESRQVIVKSDGSETLLRDADGNLLSSVQTTAYQTLRDSAGLLVKSVPVRTSATPVSASPNDQLFNDEFSGSSLTSQWKVLKQSSGGADASVTVENGYATNGSSLGLAALSRFSMADISQTAEVNLGSTGTKVAGLVARYGAYDGAGAAGYIGQLRRHTDDKLYAEILLAGGSVVLSSTEVAAASGQLRFDVIGASLRLYFNGKLVGEVVDGTYSAAGNAGIRLLNGGQIADYSAAVLGEPAGRGSSLVEGDSAADVSIAAQVVVQNNGDAAELRARKNDDYYYFAKISRESGGTKLELGVSTGSRTSFVPIVTGLTADRGRLQFDVFGSTLRLYFNGELQLVVQDTTLAGTRQLSQIATYAAGGQISALTANRLTGLESTAQGQTVRSDNFSGTAFASGWTNFGFSVNDQAIAASSSWAFVDTTTAMPNVSLSAKVDVSANGAIAGLIARRSGGYYYVGMVTHTTTNTSLTIGLANGAGTIYPFPTVTLPSSVTSGVLRFDVAGSNLSLYFNDVRVISVEDSTYTTASSSAAIGIYGNGQGKLDDFTVSNFQDIRPSYPGTTFSDSFSGSSAPWVADSGVVIGSGQVSATTGGMARLYGVWAADVALSATVTVTATNDAGWLIARDNGAGAGTYYGARLKRTDAANNKSRVELIRVVDGTETLLGFGDDITATTGTLKFVVAGNHLQVYLGDTRYIDRYEDTLNGEVGRNGVGVRLQGGSTLDNFSLVTGGPRQQQAQLFAYDVKGNLTTAVGAAGTRSETVSTMTYGSGDTNNGLVLTKTDPRGFHTSDSTDYTTAYAYDGAKTGLVSTVTTWVDAATSAVVSNTYDSANRGFLESTKQANDNNRVTSYVNDLLGRRLQMILPVYNAVLEHTTTTNDRTWTYAYYADGLSKSVIDPRGLAPGADPDDFTTTQKYDLNRRLVQTLYADGRSSRTVYDASGNAVAQSDEAGRVVQAIFDNLNRPIAAIHADGNQVRTSYTTAGNVATTTDELGNTTRFDYDAAHRLVKRTDPKANGSDTTSPIWQTRYNSVGNAIVTTDARGYSTLTDYDFLGRAIRTTAPDPGDANDATPAPVSSVRYDLVGQTMRTVDPLGRSVQTFYDGRGAARFVYAFDSAGVRQATTESQYDAIGNLTKSIDPRGYETNYAYDNRNQLTTVTLPPTPSPTHVSHTYYDQVGNVVRTTVDTEDGENLRPVDTAYDSRNRVLSVTDANDSKTRSSYDDAGNVVAVFDALGNRSLSSYDLRNRLVRSTDSLGYSNYSTYDARGSLTILKDPNGNTKTSSYDNLGRLKTQTESGISAERSWTYDANSNVLTQTDLRGWTRTFAYDPLNRRLSERWSSGTPTGYDFAYDVVGNVLNITNVGLSGTSTTFSYDYANRLASSTDYVGILVQNFYDAAGNRTALKENGTTTRGYTYDSNGRLTRVDATLPSGFGPSGGSYHVEFGYNMAGNLTSITRPFATTFGTTTYSTTYGYDDAGRPDNVHHTATNVAMDNVDYSLVRDANGRIQQLYHGDIFSDGYLYDARGQLTSSIKSAGYSSVVTSSDLTYDANGNRTGDDYVTTVQNRITKDATFENYTYDEEGNVKSRKERNADKIQYFTWDHRNRLTNFTVKNAAGTTTYVNATYSYDGLDRRTVKNVTVGNVQTFTGYVYDGSDILSEYTFASSAWTQSRHYLQAIDQVLAEEKTGDVAWLLADQLGSIRDYRSVATPSSSTHVDYDSFGQPVSAADVTNANQHLFGYAGGERDAESGLNHFGARYYDPATSRFLSTDPIDADANAYRYAGNDPINATDLSGLSPQRQALGGPSPWQVSEALSRNDFSLIPEGQRPTTFCAVCHGSNGAIAQMYMDAAREQARPLYTAMDMLGGSMEAFAGAALLPESGGWSSIMIVDGISRAGGAAERGLSRGQSNRFDIVGNSFEYSSNLAFGTPRPGNLLRDAIPLVFAPYAAQASLNARMASASALESYSVTVGLEPRPIISQFDTLSLGNSRSPWTYSMVERPGPLATMAGRPAANFAGGRYIAGWVTDDLTLYRGGDIANPYSGRWFNFSPPESIAQVRIDNAVRPIWTDAQGSYLGSSPVNTGFGINIPSGTSVYVGPTGYQGGVYLGGQSNIQIFAPDVWNMGGSVKSSWPLR